MADTDGSEQMPIRMADGRSFSAVAFLNGPLGVRDVSCGWINLEFSVDVEADPPAGSAGERTVRGQQVALAGLLHVFECQPRCRSAFEEGPTAAGDDRVDGHREFVDEVRFDELTDDRHRTLDGDLAAFTGFEVADEVNEVALDECRVLPLEVRLRQRRRGDVLGSRVDEVRERCVLAFRVVRPVVLPLLVGDPAEDAVVDFSDGRGDPLAHLLVEGVELEVERIGCDPVE